VGAYKYTEDYEHPWREGAAFVYHGGVDGLSGSPAWSERSGQESAKFGSVVSSGDVNGDGYSDVVVGAYSYDGGQPYEGAFFVYHGGADGLAETHAWSAEGDQEGAGLGYAVSATGDVDGDNYGDIIIGAPTYNGGGTDVGAAFVYLGSD
ncbi:MAG: integrin alpha, partial [Chloroflexi bacterium]|nr:integrin alpha [Chloroflexota bacterium]